MIETPVRLTAAKYLFLATSHSYRGWGFSGSSSGGCISRAACSCRHFHLVSLQNSNCLLHLGFQRLTRLQHVKKLRVVDFQQHSSYLRCKIGMGLLNQRVQPFA
uniref:Uncharacterized protein n=1 Tax=Ciona savignyi TaxID=51511 RepID=H2YTU8_CIOSA